MSQYRVFHLIKSLGKGGAETLLNDGFRYSNGEKYTYGYGYFVPDRDAVASSLSIQGAEVICFSRRNSLSMLLSIRTIARYLKQWNADLLHCHLPLAGIVGRAAARIAGIPVVYTEHNVWERYHPVTRRANLFTWKWQDSVIAVSEAIRHSIESHGGNHVPVKVIHNGIDVDAFRFSEEARNRIREKLGIPDQSRVVGTVAVFRLQKRLEDWLEAAKIINNRFNQTHFLIVGDGPQKSEVELKMRSLDLNGVVHFAGHQPDVSGFLSAMDVYMSSSLFEGLPLSIVEAASAGLPVVATAVGGVPEIVLNEQTGYLVAPRQPQSLADQVVKIFSDSELGKRLGESGREFAKQNFGIQRMTQQLEDLYTEVLNSRAAFLKRG